MTYGGDFGNPISVQSERADINDACDGGSVYGSRRHARADRSVDADEHATAQRTTYCDVSLFDGSTAYTLVRAAPLYPGGFCVIEGAAKHVLPTSGAVYVAAYATFISAVMSLVELT